MHTSNQWKDEGGYIARFLRNSRVPTWAFIQSREIVYPKPTSSVNRASSTLRLVCPFNASLHVLPLIESSTRKSSATHLEFQLCQLKKRYRELLNFQLGICRANCEPQNWCWQIFSKQNHIYQCNKFCNAAVQQTFLYLWCLFQILYVGHVIIFYFLTNTRDAIHSERCINIFHVSGWERHCVWGEPLFPWVVIVG